VSDEKRKYRNGVKFVCDAIWACGRNAVDLSSAATNALSAGNHALALSIAVLALEELGKATMIDGLLFAKAGDHKTKVFEDGHRRHPKKLERVPALHMWLQKVALVDPRSASDDTFKQALQISYSMDREVLQRVSELLGPAHGFESLGKWKQRGFYVSVDGGGAAELPSQAVPRELADQVVLLAQRLAGSTDFILRENYELYRSMVERIRGKMTEQDHQSLENAAREAVKDEDDSGEGSLGH
jgi:AbiV family abortive infection protein